MKKEMKVLGIFLLGLMTISLIASFVAAQNEQPIDIFKNTLNAFFGGESYDYLSSIFSPQILFGILIFLIIFSIISSIGIFGRKTWLSVSISIVVSILSAGFIDADWYGPLINQYTAIGITISLLLPFVLLFYFIKKVAPLNRFVHEVIWVTYFVIVLINAVLNWKQELSSFTKMLYVLIMILAGVMIISGNKIMYWIFKEETKEDLMKYYEESKRAKAALHERAEETRPWKPEEASGM